MTNGIKVSHLQDVLDYIKEHGAITNREFRKHTGLTYDDGIKIFNALCLLGLVRKTGESSGTKYILPPVAKKNLESEGYHRKAVPE